LLTWCALLLTLGLARGQATKPTVARGISMYADDIGTKFPVEALLEFVDKGHFDPVVIDWAWITRHWDRTNFAEVNRFLKALQERGIDAPAMYRPRFASDPTVPYQQKADGSPAYASGYDICFTSPEARAWGAAWGSRILEKCPDFHTIIIYDPRHQCQCPACRAALAADPDAATKTTWRFLSEARALWQAQKPDVKLGVNFVCSDLEFWQIGRDTMDLAYPYLFIYEQTDMDLDMTRAEAVRQLMGDKTRPCLAKITWGETDKVPPEKVAEFDRRAREHRMPYFIWTIETAFFDQALYDAQAVCQALGLDWEALRPPLERMGLKAALTPDQARALVEEVARTYKYGPLSQLRGARPDAVNEIIRMMEDPAASASVHLVAAVALEYTKSPLALPVLLRHVKDPDNQTRLGVAMSLGYFTDDNGEIRRALTDLAGNDPWSVTDPKTGTQKYTVREVAKQALERLAKAPDKPGAQTKYETPTDGINPPMVAPLGRVDAKAALAGKAVTFVNVGDVIRLDNTGPALDNLEFDRYVPAVDGEQIVLGRWIAAYAQDRTPLPLSIAAVRQDSQGNLVQTFRLTKVTANQTFVVLSNSLVARRERPMPEGSFPVLPADQYPSEVQPFLAATTTVQRDLPEVKAVADLLLAKSHDTLEIARAMAAMLHAKPGIASNYDPAKPMAVNVLNHGGSCCISAITAVAILRACGIPAQVTYTCPPSYIHGVTRLYLKGYGWLRMETTCGSAEVPLTHTEPQLGYVRLYDLTPEAEAVSMWGWPYMHCDDRGRHPYRANGERCLQVKTGRYVPGILGTGGEVLGGCPNAGAWAGWDDLAELSRHAVLAKTTGEFSALLGLLPEAKPFAAQMPANVPAPKGAGE
jgi:Transglutaminase-like superfamily